MLKKSSEKLNPFHQNLLGYIRYKMYIPILCKSNIKQTKHQHQLKETLKSSIKIKDEKRLLTQSVFFFFFFFFFFKKKNFFFFNRKKKIEKK